MSETHVADFTVTDFTVTRRKLDEVRCCWNVTCRTPADRIVAVTSGRSISRHMTCREHERLAIETAFTRVGQSVGVL